MAIECLEVRQFLSASVLKPTVKALVATPAPLIRPVAKLHKLPGVGAKKTRTSTNGRVTTTLAGSATPFGKTPSQVRGAYGLGVYGSNQVTFAGIQGDGTGQTIAIIDAYDYPTALTDVNAFSSQFGLPSLISNTTSLANINNASGPTFTKIGQSGSFSALPSTDPTGPYSATGGSTWEMEAALDIQWAHAMAPKANIVLVEANSSSFNNMVASAANYARTIPGVVAVSMSFGANEFSGETSYDQYFATPLNHPGGSATAGGAAITGGITFVASAGDSGAYAPGTTTITPQYPAASPNIVSVGGTNLVTSGNSYVSESAWGSGTTSGTNGGGGGGVSLYEGRPAYQATTTSALSTSNRAYPDIAMLGDPATGVPIYDSWDFGESTAWAPGYFGGTSLSAPMMAGVTAVVDQGRAIEGLGSLDGRNGTLPRLYQLNQIGAYHDITTGNNGYAAAAGYDLASGLGSPGSSDFYRAMAGGKVSGTVFVDYNGTGSLEYPDVVRSGVTVYVDINQNAVFDSGIDLSSVSDASGKFTIADAPGTFAVFAVLPTGYVPTRFSGVSGVTQYGGIEGVPIGIFNTIFTLPAGTNQFTIRTSSAGTYTDFYMNAPTTGQSTFRIYSERLTDLTVNGNTGDDTLVIDMTGGNADNFTVIHFNAAGQTGVDQVKVIAGQAGVGYLFQGNSSTSAGNFYVTETGVERSAFVGSSVDDQLTIAGVANTVFTGGGGTDSININYGAKWSPTTDLGGDGTKALVADQGNSALNFATNQHLFGLILQDGTTAVMSGTGQVLRLGYIALSANALLDLGTNSLIYDYSATVTNPTSQLNALLGTAYAAGTWAGKGIGSRAAAADSTKKHALGSSEAAAALSLSGTTTGTFAGETVDATTVLIRYTLYGDANLDATVNFNDFLTLQNNFGTVAIGFGRGNFNHDSTTDFNDFLVLQNNFGLFA
ncbi:MAG: pcp 1 [Phycisphaerales bacterium]|nr:pcp 1 [Phycisphaerales bacterium]